MKKIRIPDPSGKIETGDQLDMLWAEFYATSRVKPARQLLTAMNLSTHAGTIEKVKSVELGQCDAVIKKCGNPGIETWLVVMECRGNVGISNITE